METNDPLLKPFQLKGLTLKNRVISTSHEPAYAEDGLPTLRYQLYHEEKARGGIALTMFGGGTLVAPDTPPAYGNLYAGDDRIVPHFRELARRVHEYGAARCARSRTSAGVPPITKATGYRSSRLRLSARLPIGHFPRLWRTGTSSAW